MRGDKMNTLLVPKLLRKVPIDNASSQAKKPGVLLLTARYSCQSR